MMIYCMIYNIYDGMHAIIHDRKATGIILGMKVRHWLNSFVLVTYFLTPIIYFGHLDFDTSSSSSIP
jgi:hypothetical protein